MNKKEYKFKGIVKQCIYDTENFKIYTFDVDKKKYPDIKQTKYQSVTVMGELPVLSANVEYDITATPKESQHGTGYKVINIKRDTPTTNKDIYIFLSEFLTENQTTVLMQHYPDIIDRVRENRLDDIDLNKLKGIKEYTFNVIKNKIIENFCLLDLVVEFNGYLSLSIIRKIYNKYSSIEILKQKLKTDPYKCLCSLAGVGFKTADSILLDMEKASKENIENGKESIVEFDCDLKTSPQRCLSCVLYLLAENENEGNTKMNLADLRSQCLKTTPACADHFVKVIKSDKIYYSKETMDVALKNTYETEKYIANVVLNNINNKNNVWDFDAKKYQKVNGVILSDEQIQIVNLVCQNQISILNGASGCGKSCSTQAIINMLIDNQKSFKIFAPTGKAAKVISNFTGQKASTIHRGLEYSPVNIKEIRFLDENGREQTEYTCWGYNRQDKLFCDIVIIDEFSMVDLNLFKKVIDAIDFTKTKLLMIGDNAQLPSVGCGNLLHDFMKSKIIPTVTLTKVFRYSEGGLMKVATDVRCSKTYLDNTMKSKATVFGDNQDYVFIDLDSEAIPKNAVALYKKLLDKGNTIENIQVLTAKNVSECGTNVLNNMLQRIANPNYNSVTNIKVGDTTYYIGDLIIQKQNNYKAKLDCNHLLNNMEAVDSKQIEFDLETHLLSDSIKDEESPTVFVANGETGIIKDIYDMTVIIDFDGIYVKYSREDMNMVGLGYAITIHKCLTSDTYIYTNKGIKQLLDLIKICQFNENGVALLPDDLLIYNGKKLEKPKCLISNGVQPCKQIITTKGSCITGTYNHGLDVINSEGYIERKNISEIKDTDYLVVCKNQNIFGTNTSIPRKWHPMQQNVRAKIYNLPKTITEDFAEFLGYMVADGTIYKKGNGIRYGKNQKEVVERFQYLTQKIFNYNNATGIKHIDGKLGGMYYYEINSVYINSFLSKIDGIQPNDKFVPNCIMESPQNIQIKFLKGLFEDGTVNVKIHEDKKHFDHIELSLKDGNIIKQIRMMLLNLGICSTITSRIRTKDNNMYSQNVIYIYKQNAKIFNRLIGFTSNDKKENLDLCNETILNSRSVIPNIYKIIVKIKEKYNLRLKDCNNELHAFAFRKNTKGLTTRLLKCFLDYYKTILSDDTDYQYLEFLYYHCNIEKVDKIIDNIVKPTYCVEMPDSHKFIQNGFYGWNSQGSSIDNVILCTPQSHIFMLNNNLLYTGLTRMRKKCYHLGTLKSVNQAIGKKANLERNTFMQELLKINA